MTKLNRKISSARKLRHPLKIARSKLSQRQQLSKKTRTKPASAPFENQKPKPFVAKKSTEDEKVAIPTELPGPALLPESFRKLLLRFILIQRAHPRHLVSVLALLSCIMILMIISGLWQAMNRKESLIAEKSILQPALSLGEIESRKQTSSMAIVSGFLSGKTIEEKLAFVRHPKAVEHEIRTLFEDKPTWEKVIPAGLGPNPVVRNFQLAGKDTTAIRTTISPGQPSLIFLLTGSPLERQLIDWEASTALTKSPFTDFREERPTQPQQFRIFITPDDYYNYGFAPEDYHCLRINDLESPESVIFAYAKRNSPVENTLREIYPAIGSFFGTAAVTAELRYPPGSKSPDHLELVSIIHPNWILPDSFYEQ